MAVGTDEVCLRQHEPEHGKTDGDAEPLDAQDKILVTVKSRKMRGNVSCFTFTATPKNTALEKFGVPQPGGSFAPFDLYSMKHTVEEVFILDVIANDAAFKTSFREMLRQAVGA